MHQNPFSTDRGSDPNIAVGVYHAPTDPLVGFLFRLPFPDSLDAYSLSTSAQIWRPHAVILTFSVWIPTF